MYKYISQILVSVCMHLIFPSELEIKDTTKTDRSAGYVDVFLDIVVICFFLIVFLSRIRRVCYISLI